MLIIGFIAIVQLATATTLTLSGNVETAGSGKPVQIQFVDNLGKRYVAYVSDNTFYSVELPNGNSNYNVIVSWEELGDSVGTCDAGTLGFTKQSIPLMFRDFGC